MDCKKTYLYVLPRKGKNESSLQQNKFWEIKFTQSCNLKFDQR